MRWRDQRRSENVEDRRGMGGRTVALGGGGIGMLILILLVYLCGGDPESLIKQMPTGGQQSAPQQQTQSKAGKLDEEKEFVRAVLGSTEDVWTRIFAANGLQYQLPKLVLFEQSVPSACGYASAAMGPFYCPGDEKLYLDLSFFDQLRTEFSAPGDFAAAYVIAHEVGHHVQNQLGRMEQVNAAQARASKAQGNQLSVRLELQADCYAGVWAGAAKEKGLLDEGDAEEAIKAAKSVGDDMIQKRAQGYIVPESFTHGSAQDRTKWFTRGMESKDPKQCETFKR